MGDEFAFKITTGFETLVLAQGLQTHSVNEMILTGWKSTREMILEFLN